jgi:hypothetical protein
LPLLFFTFESVDAAPTKIGDMHESLDFDDFKIMPLDDGSSDEVTLNVHGVEFKIKRSVAAQSGDHHGQ